MTDYSKLVERLRSTARNVETDFGPSLYQTKHRAATIREAADVIEKLVREKEEETHEN